MFVLVDLDVGLGVDVEVDGNRDVDRNGTALTVTSSPQCFTRPTGTLMDVRSEPSSKYVVPVHVAVAVKAHAHVNEQSTPTTVGSARRAWTSTGVMVLGERVVEVGGADTALLAWIAERDSRGACR
ncbi:MAG TPA: hypothetical protein PLI95_30235 [Polyangiaceae bacterium]|nr:hypothetical protein [Polyangiaceae bacterium]